MPQPPAPESRHPSGDKRFGLLDATIRRHQRRPDALIEVLHVAQEQFGHLSTDLLIYVAQALDLPPSRVYGVATFYNFFCLAPRGQHRCVVCVGTACYVKAAAEVVSAIGHELALSPGETSADGQISLDLARCLGSCGLAPVVVLDDQTLGKLEPAALIHRVRQWRLAVQTANPAGTALAEGAP